MCGAYLLDRSRMHPLLAELPEIIHLPARVGRHPVLRGAIELLGAELDGAPRPGADAAVSALLDLLLLLHILRAWLQERSAASEDDGWSAALRDPAVASALRAVHGDPAHPWTVGELAGVAGLSRAAFARRFTALVGRPPLTYLTWWRMTIAARLLRTTDLPHAAIARKIGYASEHAFANAFKREFTMPPGAYRRSGPGRSSSASPPPAEITDSERPPGGERRPVEGTTR